MPTTRASVGIAFGAGFALGLALSPYARVRSAREVLETPHAFSELIRPSADWGLFRRRLDRPLPLGGSSEASEALWTYIDSFLRSPAYRLELVLSQAPLDEVDRFRLNQGSAVGNLQVESLPTRAEVIFKYCAPGFNFRLYLATPSDREIIFGFVDYSGSFISSLGQRVYAYMCLVSTARKLDRGWIDKLHSS
ncbi:uncharacterized protein BJ171DRAFT_510861 [Polychytrium aggregatum]|uniref:uncharacterized protein n=1 Tax=Polychytrium aggregatum TaxID=110093 RepID=UPI0022FDCBA8|nr:uncharacterized protein BJ171DRAFT_510861 [Polychytrium aggregatum]KAI9203089.1 hypothetical protein BJ171DRAFT_510861 [Polychytrium aggregatum]